MESVLHLARMMAELHLAEYEGARIAKISWRKEPRPEAEYGVHFQKHGNLFLKMAVSCKMKSDTKKGQAEAPVVECFCKPNNTERGILHVQETFYHKYTKLQASNCFSKRSDTGTLEGGIA